MNDPWVWYLTICDTSRYVEQAKFRPKIDNTAFLLDNVMIFHVPACQSIELECPLAASESVYRTCRNCLASRAMPILVGEISCHTIYLKLYFLRLLVQVYIIKGRQLCCVNERNNSFSVCVWRHNQLSVSNDFCAIYFFLLTKNQGQMELFNVEWYIDCILLCKGMLKKIITWNNSPWYWNFVIFPFTLLDDIFNAVCAK